MNDITLRALVVDDEPIARRMVMGALTREGFQCEPAVDGVHASEKLSHGNYDLVVTDLRMPNKNGHVLTVDLLAQAYPPVLVVHSSVDDPRLTKDLMARGVDDIIYKPTNYEAFAAKVKVLVRRRREERAAAKAAAAGADGAGNEGEGLAACFASVEVEEFDARLAECSHILPVSDVAVEVLEHVRNDDFDTQALARVIERDAALAAQLLRLANSSIYNRQGSRVIELQEAVARVGAKRIGEVSLAVSALGALTSSVVPWFDRELAWKRSLAGAMTANRILERQGSSIISHGIVFSALMYPLGRVVVGAAYSDVYHTLLADCRRNQGCLAELEQDVFPRTPAASTAQVLSRWDVPPEVCVPLVHADIPFARLPQLAEPIRSNVKALKMAILLGEYVVGKWMPWDRIDLPPDSLLQELGLEAPRRIIEEVRRDLEAIVENDGIQPRSASTAPTPVSDPQSARYYNPATEIYDFVAPLLRSMNMKLDEVPAQTPVPGDDLIVNSINRPPAELAEKQAEAGGENWLMLLRDPAPDALHEHGSVLRLPLSYRALQTACQRLAENAGGVSRTTAATG